MKEKLKQLSLSELRLVAERTERRMVRVPDGRGKTEEGARPKDACYQRDARRCQTSAVRPQTSHLEEVVVRVPWRVWYVAASNGDLIAGEEVVTLAVELGGPGVYPSRLVQFTASGQTRRLRDCCILRANDFQLIV